MTGFDARTLRDDFPILSRNINGRPLVYLDNAATTQKPQVVVDAIVRYYTTMNANIHRGIHTLAIEATEAYEDVRNRVGRFIGGEGYGSVVFTRNATESLNLVARAWGEANLRPGDEVVLTVMEHHSNIVPWQLVARRTGAVLRYIDIDEEGHLNLDQARALIGPRTRVVAVTHASNVLGTINPVADLAEMAREAGAILVVDGAQSVPHMPVDVRSLGCDFLAFSAHKMLGPTGVGVLWARPGLLEEMEPFLGGGEMISVVRPEESIWADVPHKFEAGTPNIADVIAFGAALDYLDRLGMDAVRAHEIDLVALALERLGRLPGLVIYGPRDPAERGGVVSFTIDGIHPHDIATIADSYGIAIRAGHHCAQILTRRLGQAATSRASFYVYNVPEEVDALAEALEHAIEVFRRGDTRAAIR